MRLRHGDCRSRRLHRLLGRLPHRRRQRLRLVRGGRVRRDPKPERGRAFGQEGARLNLERSLRVGDELGGHIVTGHVDAVGEVEAAAEVGGSVRLTVIAPAELEGYIAPKGSIALDGVSLTVNEVEPVSDGVRFALNIIPHTAAQTSFAELAEGRKVNIEIDILARYIGRMLELRR